MLIKDKLINYFGKNIKDMLKDIDSMYFEKAEEIRIRLGKSIIIKTFSKEYFLLEDRSISTKFDKKIYIPTNEDIRQTIETMSDYSIYAFEQEIKRGFLTLQGGFRVGITGRVVIENDKVKTIKNISSINIRIAREIIDCSKKILRYIYSPNSINSTLIISPPNCGKTTILRDIIRSISNSGENVGLVDERSEIASIYMGSPQLDVGERTDILDRCPKVEGMIMLLRSMSPRVIAVDEIGGLKDIEAIEKVSNSGVDIICTIHSENIEDLKQKENMKNLLDKRIFKRFIVLNKNTIANRVGKIYDEFFNIIYEEVD